MQKIPTKPEQTLTPSDWMKLCDEWEHSGEKQQVFCEKRKINYTTFVYWRMKYKKEKLPVEQNIFSTVNIKPPSNNAVFKIHLLNGIGLTVPLTLDKASLKMLFELLGVSSC